MRQPFRGAARAVCLTGLVLFGALGPVGLAGSARAATPAPVPSATTSPSSLSASSSPATTAPAADAGPQLGFSGPFQFVETGGPIWIGVAGMPEGWTEAVASSPALVEPVPLVPEPPGLPGGGPGNGRPADQEHTYRVRADIAPGTYTVTLTSGGRTVVTAPLTVVAPGSADITRFVLGPREEFLGGDASVAVRPGAEAVVVLTDYRAADGESSLLVKSPVFERPLKIVRNGPDDPGCKCDDGGTVFSGHARVRHGVRPGTYDMTVVSHHGKETTTRRVTIAGEPVTDPKPWLIGGGAAAGLLVLAAVVRTVIVRRRRGGAHQA
ncbi:hypothetical protein ACIBEA_39440 [Streptomyces sp. NPDC051555]|uniref:hypothetical protein n=1 Tax=Streptomyces sp. NPDC051555 TaxID=3365657 RepID=UPI003795C1F8